MNSAVAIALASQPAYTNLTENRDAPELPDGYIRTVAQQAVRELLRVWGLDASRFGTSKWNPLGAFIRPGATVVLKPNWVYDHNRSGGGMDCLVTHPSVIEAVLDYVALARPSSIVIGDAPVQGCDFLELVRKCDLNALIERFQSRGLDVCIRDFRRTMLARSNGPAKRVENCRDRADYVLFDLGKQSLLEPLATDSGRFRVTMYDPDRLLNTHRPGRHQYLIAKEVVDADVIVNLPKLKCHKKSCVTGALKNLVGINGNKEFLPHHRKGGDAQGGDCYSGRSTLKLIAEHLYDVANRRKGDGPRRLLTSCAESLIRLGKRFGQDDNIEGSWYGNDTIWRTCLDLQRILRYGRSDGELAGVPQRTVITITDAIIAGEGEGPMAPEPVGAAFVSGSLSTAAADCVHAALMGFDYSKIALIAQAFGSFTYPLCDFGPADIGVLTSQGIASIDQVRPILGRPFRPPQGWKDQCILAAPQDGRIVNAAACFADGGGTRMPERR